MEWSELIVLAKKKEKVIVEAARHIFEPNFIKTADIIKNMRKIYGASLSYSSYSSRYDNVLAGEEPYIFSSKFGGGATNDLGIYVVMLRFTGLVSLKCTCLHSENRNRSRW